MVPPGRPKRNLGGILLFAAFVFLFLALLLHASDGNTAVLKTGNPCLHTDGHVFEACFAYFFNDSGRALWTYYTNGRSADPSKAGDALEDFFYRFRGSARQLIISRVDSWPKGENIVAIPRIRIIDASASLVTNTAMLITRETWRVTSTSGRVVYAENNRLHHITMKRVQGKFLHIWVVTAIH